LLPSDHVHGYFGWYASAIGVLSLAALVALAVLMTAGLAGASGTWITRLRAALRPQKADVSSARCTGGLAASSVVFLVIQESLERSVELGRPALAVFTPSTWLLLAGVSALIASIVVWLTRSCTALIDHVFAAAVHRGLTAEAVPNCARRALAELPRRHPLADRRGTRAPPAYLV